MLGLVDFGAQQLAKQDVTMQVRMRQAIIDQTLRNIEVLTGVGRLDEARMLTGKLLGFDGTETARAAVKRHVDRATASPVR